MIASWPQAALRGGTALANTGNHGPVCSVRGSSARRVRRTGPQQKAEAARLQEAAQELSTLPETWERTSLSDEGIREALRAWSKYFAALDEPELADSGSISPESEREHVEDGNGSSPSKQPQRKTPQRSVTPSSTKSSEAMNEEGLSERQKRRRRVGWALHQRRVGKPGKTSRGAERPKAALYSREVEAQLCSQIQEAQRLRQVCEDIAGGRQQLPDLEWARAAGLKSTRALRSALQAGSAAEKRLVSEHHGFLLSLAKRFTRQGVSNEELLVEAKSSLIRVAEKFDTGRNARLTSYAWFDIMSSLQQLCQNEGALLPMARSALRDLIRLDRAEAALVQQTGNDPTLQEVAARAGVTHARARMLRDRQKTVAYEAINADFKDGNQRGADEITGGEDATAEDPDTVICEREKALHVRSIVSLALDALAASDARHGKLNSYNQRLICAMRLRYGLDDDRPRTLKEVSQEMHNSIETVRTLVEEGKEQLAEILAQMGLMKDIQMSA